MNNKIEFMASIPQIQSAINTGNDGMRVKFDIPESDIGQAVRLIMLRGKAFKVTIEEVE
ncbi:hypothetical protein [Tepidibacter thalassicus]|uniref:Uncharacterized protein n=1 Tax=Tepidibacter thalassicus DSM 15285 TaxID=1123350 RepID=A0A1M5PY21_9FIRM|nr:hypothetical protein [Tepidibacter thalassicus]SHH06163.1 hypothetical protein SAMN02744040_00645 [Tepidibacter thalassicus DSM 15285]